MCNECSGIQQPPPLPERLQGVHGLKTVIRGLLATMGQGDKEIHAKLLDDAYAVLADNNAAHPENRLQAALDDNKRLMTALERSAGVFGTMYQIIFRCGSDGLKDSIEESAIKIRDALDARDAQLAEMALHVNHPQSCGSMEHEDATACTCGLTDLLERVEANNKAVPS